MCSHHNHCNVWPTDTWCMGGYAGLWFGSRAKMSLQQPGTEPRFRRRPCRSLITTHTEIEYPCFNYMFFVLRFWRCSIIVKVKWSCYRPGVAQRVGRGIALLFHDRGTRRRWVVSSTPRPHSTSGKDPEPILQEAGWAPGPVWTGGKSLPHRDSIPDRPARSESLYRPSYPAHCLIIGYRERYLDRRGDR